MSRVVMTLGDSQTIGFPVGTAPSWRAFLARVRPGWFWVGTITDQYGMKTNAVSGYSTANVLTALPGVLTTLAAGAQTPTDCTIMLGGNDILQGLSTAQFVANMNSIIALVKGTFPAINIWVFTICPYAPLQAQIDLQTAAILGGSVTGINGGIVGLAALTYPANSFQADNLHLAPTGCLFVTPTIATGMGA